MKNVIHILQERGLFEAMTSDQLEKKVDRPVLVYCGFDPTSESLHLGNFVALMGLAWFQRCGHTPVVLLGGATGMIGDPSGKSRERQLLDEETLQRNVEGIQKDCERVFDRSGIYPEPIVLNNYEWMKDFSMLTFLRDVGKHFRVGQMLGKESVRQRIASEEGMSFTEFSYQLLQGYDFYHLNEQCGVDVQIGGSDQWGNITAGMDVTRRLNGNQVFGLTLPLLVASDGKKFGKSEKGAIWLSKKRLSPYHFYQYLVGVSDEDVIKLLKMITFLPIKEIHALEKEMEGDAYVPHTAQKRLAEEVTRIVHGEKGLKEALLATEVARPGCAAELSLEALRSVTEHLPMFVIEENVLIDMPFVDLLVVSGMLGSKGQARRLIEQGGAYLNNQNVKTTKRIVDRRDFIGGEFVLIQIGKKNKQLIRIKRA